MEPSNFADYTVAEPGLEEIRKRYHVLFERIDSATDAETCFTAVQDWDLLLQELTEWSKLTEIRFYQDTDNSDYKAAQDRLDFIWPKYVDLETQMKRKLLESPFRDDLEKVTSPQLFDLWQCKIRTFDPVIEKDLSNESKLSSEYTALTAKAQLNFNGKSLTLSEIGKHFEDPDRAKRKVAYEVHSAWFGENAVELDRIYDEQVTLRHSMACKLGYDNFVDLGYQRMARVGYGPEEVCAFREEVKREVVPLCNQLANRQAQRLGVDTLMHWDECVHNPDGNPRPQGEHDWMIERAREMFKGMGHGLDDFFENMHTQGMMDLKSRRGKGGGGFCEFLHLLGYPFIFANFNGTRADVDVFTHEMGHAFQVWSSSHLPMSEMVWPTTEACEIHSMGLEFLSWPWMELFYGEKAAEELRKIHLTSSIMFIPYGVSIDLFQHMVYENPKASPEDRNVMWQEIEQTYLPWYHYGELSAQRSGRLWQMKQHIYNSPFYYIDYTLALTGALQFWHKSQANHELALSDYSELCRRGGTLPFSGLLDSAGLNSPFSQGCLKSVIADARRYLL